MKFDLSLEDFTIIRCFHYSEGREKNLNHTTRKCEQLRDHLADQICNQSLKMSNTVKYLIVGLSLLLYGSLVIHTSQV